MLIKSYLLVVLIYYRKYHLLVKKAIEYYVFMQIPYLDKVATDPYIITHTARVYQQMGGEYTLPPPLQHVKKGKKREKNKERTKIYTGMYIWS